MAKTDPITGQRIKTGGRKVGTPNVKTTARHEAMARVNEALAAMGDDTLTGTKLCGKFSGIQTRRLKPGFNVRDWCSSKRRRKPMTKFM